MAKKKATTKRPSPMCGCGHRKTLHARGHSTPFGTPKCRGTHPDGAVTGRTRRPCYCVGFWLMGADGRRVTWPIERRAIAAKRAK